MPRAELCRFNQLGIEVPFLVLPFADRLDASAGGIIRASRGQQCAQNNARNRHRGFCRDRGLLACIHHPAGSHDLPRIGVGAFLLYASILTLTWRMLFIRIYRTTGQRRRILLIGAGKAGQTLAELYQTEGTRSFHIIGFIDDDLQKVGKKIQGLPVVGSSKQLLHMIDAYRISDLVVAINGEIQGATFQAILDAQEKGVDVTRMPILYEEMTSRVPVHHLESDWIIRSFVDELHVSGFYDLFKRLVDILGGAAGLLIFAISFPFLGLAVAIDSGFPILYSQPRLGSRRSGIYDL